MQRTITAYTHGASADEQTSADDSDGPTCDYSGCTDAPAHDQELSDGTPTRRCSTHRVNTDLAPPF